MKIATALFKYFPYGGLQLDFRRIVQELIARGHTVICFTGSWEGDPIEGLDLRIIPLKSISNHARAAEFEKKVHAQLNDLSVDRFVAFNRMGGADLYFAADNCLLPAWQKKHSSFILNLLPRYRTFLRQERAVFGPESRTKILYLVESQKQEYQTCYGTDDKRFLPLPPKCRTSRRPPRPRPSPHRPPSAHLSRRRGRGQGKVLPLFRRCPPCVWNRRAADAVQGRAGRKEARP